MPLRAHHAPQITGPGLGLGIKLDALTIYSSQNAAVEHTECIHRHAIDRHSAYAPDIVANSHRALPDAAGRQVKGLACPGDSASLRAGRSLRLSSRDPKCEDQGKWACGKKKAGYLQGLPLKFDERSFRAARQASRLP